MATWKTRKVHDKDVPAGMRETGKWYGLWEEARQLKLNGDEQLEVRFDSNTEVERARTAMSSYSRRSAEPWKIKTHRSQLRPAILYLKKVDK